MATSCTDNEEVSLHKQVYHCPICLEAMKTPRGLPCLHTFCEECLHTYITAAADKDVKNIVCPVCRKQIPAPEMGIPYTDWSSRFPLNYLLIPVETADVPGQQVEEECKICFRGEKKTCAKHYCKNCAEAICDSCKSLHVFVTALKNHHIVTLENHRSKPTLPDVEEMCQLHPSKTLEVFCLDHKKMCCSICFATQHRHCSDVRSLDDCANKLEEGCIRAMVEKLNSLSKNVDSELSEKELIGKKLRKSKEHTICHMKVLVNVAQKNLQSLLETFEMEVNLEQLNNEAKLQTVVDVLRGIHTSLVCDQQMLTTALTYGSKRQIFVSAEKIKMQIAEQTKLAASLALTKLSHTYLLYAQDVQDIVELKSIGSVKGVSSEQPSVSQGLISELSSINLPSDKDLTVHPKNLAWIKRWSYNLNGRCYGLTFLGRNIAAVQSNKTLTVVNEKGQKMYVHKIPGHGKPADINAVDDTTVYISFREFKTLKKFRVDAARITEIGEIALQQVAEGFCLFGDRIVHASSSAVYISTLAGHLIKSIASHQYTGDIGLLSGSSLRETFCHTDGKYLCIRNLEGEVIHREQVTGRPCGLALDFQGNVYVCCKGDGKILQVSHKDFSVREISGFRTEIYVIAFDTIGKSFAAVDFGIYEGVLEFHSLSV